LCDQDQAAAPTTIASTLFTPPVHTDPNVIVRTRHQQADRLLRRLNHLLRWYRVTADQPVVIELTRAQASPFQFIVEGTKEAWGDTAPLEYEAQPPLPPSVERRMEFGKAVLNGLRGKTDPDVAALNLLDAQYAMSVGRFREAVLLCWGAIDSTVVREFRNLVDKELTDEWADGLAFLKGVDFGLRHKMTTGFRMLAGRSLFSEPDGFWDDISASYGLRNRIIHEGHIAHEDDAKLAITVTRRVVQAVAQLIS
jgi:hypothetical protein